jgi:hypothetical protein
MRTSNGNMARKARKGSAGGRGPGGATRGHGETATRREKQERVGPLAGSSPSTHSTGSGQAS